MTLDWAPLTLFVLAGFENRFLVFPVYLNFVAPLQWSFIFIVLVNYRVLLQLNQHPIGARKINTTTVFFKRTCSSPASQLHTQQSYGIIYYIVHQICLYIFDNIPGYVNVHYDGGHGRQKAAWVPLETINILISVAEPLYSFRRLRIRVSPFWRLRLWHCKHPNNV